MRPRKTTTAAWGNRIFNYNEKGEKKTMWGVDIGFPGFLQRTASRSHFVHSRRIYL